MAIDYPSLDKPTAGAFRFNTDSSQLEIYRGDQWTVVLSTSSEQQTGGTRGLFYGGNTPSNRDRIEYIQINTTGNSVDFGNLLSAALAAGGGSADRTRGLISGGAVPSASDVIQYVTISSTGNAIDFGNLTVARTYCASVNNSTRSVTGGAFSPLTNTIDYVTIQSTGDSEDFGDLTQERLTHDGSCESPTRGVFMGGLNGGSPYVDYNVIDYITIATTGNAADFGDIISQAKFSGGGCGNVIRGLHMGGNNLPANLTEIDYITIGTLGNSIDFGDLVSAAYYTAACSSPTRGVCAGGIATQPARHNVIQYVQIMSTGNAVDFGDILDTTYELGALSNGNGGL